MRAAGDFGVHRQAAEVKSSRRQREGLDLPHALHLEMN
jgi:hypothetical protein